MEKRLILQLAFTPFLIGGIYFGFLSIRFMFVNGISIFGIMNLLASFIVFYGARELPKRFTPQEDLKKPTLLTGVKE